jgi:hypothetical protein
MGPDLAQNEAEVSRHVSTEKWRSGIEVFIVASVSDALVQFVTAVYAMGVDQQPGAVPGVQLWFGQPIA